MGTSASHLSPKTTNWRVVDIGYSTEQEPTERLVVELWRYATNQGGVDLAVGLASSVVLDCLNVALRASSRKEAAAAAGRIVAFSGQASIAADIAQRAAIRSVGMEGDRAMNFARALFSEAGDYLVSRDISGFIGPNGRVKTVREAIRLKGIIRVQIDSIIAQGPSPPTKESEAWRQYVAQIMSKLAVK